MDTYKEAYKRLTSAQKQAVDSIEGPLLVIAGPGTGKTQLLALRAAHILEVTDVLPQNILCLTYTENGTRNMRERLMRFMGQTAYDVRISTYHSFGSEIMREYGDYFNSGDPGEPADKLAQDAIMHEVYEGLPSSNLLWRSDTYLKDALTLISDFKKALLSPDDVRAIARDNVSFITKASGLVTTAMEGFSRMSKSTVHHFETIHKSLELLLQKNSLPTGTQNLSVLAISELKTALEAFEEDGKNTKQITAWKDTWLQKNSKNEWIFAGALEAQKMLDAADIFEKYTKVLKAKKLFDYDDMILRAIHGLEQHDDLRFSLQERFLYIMLDEFQDTNPAQLRLIELLTNNPVSNRRPDVMAVGDDDQAIFSFQGADHTNMLKFYDLYDDVRTINLTENWRSHGDIVVASKNIAEQIEERIHHDPRIGLAHKELTAANTKLPNNSILERRAFASDVAQFSWIADTILARITSGLDPKEIAIIAPRHKHLEPLVSYLHSRGIPIHYEKREDVLQEPKIVELLSVARLIMALQNHEEDLADALWPTVLSADYWQLPVSTIWQLSWQAHANRKDGKQQSWHQLMMANETLKPIALFFAKLAASASTETLETMLDYITGICPVDLHETDLDSFTSPYFANYFGDPTTTKDSTSYMQLLSDLTVLREHLRAYKRDEMRPLILQDLLDFVKNYEQAGEKLLNTSPYHSASNAVELMTVYGAKGLEFHTVFVVAASDEVWGKSARDKSSNIALPKNLLYIRRVGTTKDERKRLFFVALSRAKVELQITSYTQNFAGKTMQSLEFLDEQVIDDTTLASMLPSDKQKVIQHTEEGVAVEQLRDFWFTRHHEALLRPDLLEMVQPQLDGFQMSATHLNSFTDLVHGGPQDFFLYKILRFPKATSIDGHFGSAMHETMKDVHSYLAREGELPTVEAVTEMFQKRLLVKQLSKIEHLRQLERGSKALEKFLPFWWDSFLLESEAERNFRNEGAFVGKAHLAGALDLLIKDDEAKELLIVDFKTGKGHSYWKKDDPRLYKYKQQLLFYKLLTENSAAYRHHTATEGKLVFLEPEAGGDTIQQLSLLYDEADVERMKRLIEVIWQHIQDLNFPDVSSYSKDVKGIIQFEEDLLSGKL